MITPGFFGLFNAHRGLIAAQNAMNTINHNVTNANTAGYSRQRVDLTAYTPYTMPSTGGPNGGQLGQGPIMQQVTRSRDVFLDDQFRMANTSLGMKTSMRDALQQVEGILNEPSTGGINSALQNFFDSAQEMSLHPESTAVQSDYVQHAVDLITVFQQQASQLTDVRRNLVGDPNVPSSLATSQAAITVSDINDKLQAITALNGSIVSVQASGAQANDLLDQRDKLLDDLSKLVDTQVTHFDNGQINLSIGGQLMIRGNSQIDSLQIVTNPGPAPLPDDVPALVQTVNSAVTLNDGAGAELTGGELKGVLDMGSNDPNLSTVRNVLGKLDNLIGTLVTQVNTIQQAGMDQNGNPNPPALFVSDPTINPTQTLGIFHWVVNPAIISNTKLVSTAINDPTAPSGYAGVGDGRNALNVAQLRDQTFAALGTGFTDYMNGIVSKLGIDTKSYEDGTTAQTNLVSSVDTQRQSISGVNVDEEMIDMLRYQRAFEATSKVVSMFSDVYKTIINMI